MSEAADAAMIEAADADGRLRDDPLTDCPVDEAAAAERERSAKAAKLAAQTANAMVAVRGQYQTTLTLTRHLGPGAVHVCFVCGFVCVSVSVRTFSFL